MYVYFIVNVNKCLKPFFLEQHTNIVNIVTLKSFWLICTRHKSVRIKSGRCVMRKNECSFFLRLKVMLPLSSQMGVYCAAGGALVALKLNTHFLIMIYAKLFISSLKIFFIYKNCID